MKSTAMRFLNSLEENGFLNSSKEDKIVLANVLEELLQIDRESAVSMHIFMEQVNKLKE